VTGQIPLRDARGRLRPLPAALVSIAVMTILGMALTAITE
jgi:hypothetical protein